MKMRIVVFPVVLLCGACAHVPARAGNGDLADVLSELDATAQGVRSNGQSAVACEKLEDWKKAGEARDVATNDAKVMLLEAAVIAAEYKKSSNGLEARIWSCGTLWGNQITESWGERWVCVRLTSTTVDVEQCYGAPPRTASD